MNYFFAIVHKDEDSAFGVEFPDLPGCFSAADRIEDVLANAVEALQLWFEDQPAIAPSSLGDIREAASASLAAGAFVVSVPLLSNAGKVKRVNLSFDAGTLDAIDTAAQARRLTRSAFLAEAARNEIVGRH
jgi:predicted RNase H-like HicB family nuclease